MQRDLTSFKNTNQALKYDHSNSKPGQIWSILLAYLNGKTAAQWSVRENKTDHCEPTQ